jgi:hypothetical protein
MKYGYARTSADDQTAARREVWPEVEPYTRAHQPRWKLIDKDEARQYVADLLDVGRVTLHRALPGQRTHFVFPHPPTLASANRSICSTSLSI